MTFPDFLVSQAMMSARGDKARMQRRSRRSSERQAQRATPNKGKRSQE